MSRRKHPACLAGGVVLLGFLTMPLLYVHGNTGLETAYQTSSSKRVQDDGQIPSRAETLPTSDNLVYLQIIIGGQVVKAAQREGGLIRIEQDGKIFGVTPHIRSIDDNTISVDIFRITKIVNKGGIYVGDAINITQTLDVNKLTAAVTDTSPSFSIQVERIKPDVSSLREVEKAESKLERYQRLLSQSCCVTCGSTSACGCAVGLTCGSCCSGDCCY